MHRLAHRGTHAGCCAKGWETVPKVTGDPDFDATIMHRKNRDMPARLAQHLAIPAVTYGPRTSYHSYSANHGDD
jgi:hypothetical protein